MKEQKKATSNVKTADEMNHMRELPKEQLSEHFQDHIAFLIMGKCEGKDIFMALGMYHVGGKVWGITDGIVQQTNLIITPSDHRTISNNEFVGNRIGPTDESANFQVVQESDRVIWKTGNRQITCRMPYWELKGEHMGVDLDLTIGGIGDCIPYHGPWTDLAAKGLAGNEHLCWASGSFIYQGKKYTLDEGWAVRERTCLGKGWDVLTLLGHSTGYIWGWCFSESVKVFCFAEPEVNRFLGRVWSGDQVLGFGPGQIKVEPLERWKDPMTDVTIPIKWKINMESEAANLEMNVATWSRALYGFHLAKGYTTHYCVLGRTNGSLVFSDGKNVALNDCQTYFETAKATALPKG